MYQMENNRTKIEIIKHKKEEPNGNFVIKKCNKVQ